MGASSTTFLATVILIVLYEVGEFSSLPSKDLELGEREYTGGDAGMRPGVAGVGGTAE